MKVMEDNNYVFSKNVAIAIDANSKETTQNAKDSFIRVCIRI